MLMGVVGDWLNEVGGWLNKVVEQLLAVDVVVMFMAVV